MKIQPFISSLWQERWDKEVDNKISGQVWAWESIFTEIITSPPAKLYTRGHYVELIEASPIVIYTCII